MLIEIIEQQAAEKLLAFLEEKNRRNMGGGAILFRRSTLLPPPAPEDFLLTVRGVIGDKSAAMYFLPDNDVVITWRGSQKKTLEELCTHLYDRYAPNTSDKLHSYFDLLAQGEELRLVCRRHIAGKSAMPHASRPSKPASRENDSSKPVSVTLQPTLQQKQILQHALVARMTRRQPVILAVEDQSFSRNLLLGMLAGGHVAFGAGASGQALELYCKHAPDLVFLDIELPDVNGHDFAALLRALDANSYVVMVTAHSHKEDVLRARENGVRGYIVKPYSRQKIENSIEIFMQEWNKRHL